jgi:type IV secretion system protein VirD4
MAAPFSISFGRKWNPKSGRTGQLLSHAIDGHVTCFGPTGSGKGVALEIPNLLRLEGLSIISIDPKGQNAAVTARWRRTVSDVLFLNPLDVLGLGSAGFNPLSALDPASPHFFLHASAIAEALVRHAEKGDPFFDISARNLVLALIMWEVKCARAEGRAPLLQHVRGMLTGDLPAHAKAMFESGDFVLASLAGQFMEMNRTNAGIIATAASQTQWLLSQPMLDDLAKDGIDWSQLKTNATTVYVILPAHALETFSPWLRLVVACAFNALYRQENGAGLRTLFMLSEFAQLGKLSMVSAALAQGRGYGIAMFPVLQDLNQLRATYGKDEANTFLGMSVATFGFTPNDPETAEWMSKRAGEVIVPGMSVGDDPRNGPHGTRRPERQRAIPADDMMSLPRFHGLVFLAGQSAAQPVYVPPYWDRRGNPDLVGRYDPDPYHPGGGPSGHFPLRRVIKAAVVAAVAVAIVVGGVTLLRPSGAHVPTPVGMPAPLPPVFHHFPSGNKAHGHP